MTNGRVVGIEVLPHDKGTYLIQSRTARQDYHLVEFVSEWVEDPETGELEERWTGKITCTCSGYQFRKECFHIKYICKLLGVKTPQATNNHNQLAAA